MISINQLRIYLYPILKLLSKTGSTLEIAYDGKAYELFLRPSDAKVRKKYTPRFNKRKKALNPHTFKYEGCSSCGELMINGVCMNNKCQTVAKETI